MTTTVPTLFRQLPLVQRMRLAVEVLEEVNKRARLGAMAQWSIERLTKRADLWEAENAHAEDREKQIEELAQILANTMRGNGDSYYNTAEALLDNGWSKS